MLGPRRTSFNARQSCTPKYSRADSRDPKRNRAGCDDQTSGGGGLRPASGLLQAIKESVSVAAAGWNDKHNSMSKAMALSNWWEWGEWQGFEGDDAFHNVTCGFCSTRGGWKIVSQFAKTKDRKTLHFDTAQCPNCGNYVLAFWTTSVMGGRHSMHNVKQLPWPLDGKPEPSKEWPKQAANYWVQAHDNLRRENWEAAIMLARTALQSVARDKGAKSSKLKDEIDDLGNKSILPPNMIEWAHAVIRDPGNEMTHPAKDQPPANRKDARDVVGYLDFVLEYVYDLPKRIESFRNPEGK